MYIFPENEQIQVIIIFNYKKKVELSLFMRNKQERVPGNNESLIGRLYLN